MRALALVALAFVAPSCRKEAPAPPAPAPATAPTETQAQGAFHAVECRGVTAEWLGQAPDAPAPKAWGATALRFKFDGATRPFEPAGALEATDWSFDVFSPDCARVALLQDHYGPWHVVSVTRLAEYLAGGSPDAVVQQKGEAEAMVHGQLQWRSPTQLEFTASCCGGVEAFVADVAPPAPPRRVFFAAQAPHGVRRTADGGWEVAP